MRHNFDAEVNSWLIENLLFSQSQKHGSGAAAIRHSEGSFGSVATACECVRTSLNSYINPRGDFDSRPECKTIVEDLCHSDF